MPTVHFRPRVRWGNTEELDRRYLPNVQAPAGVPVQEPIFISAQRMFELSPRAPLSGVVGGLTDVELTVSFADLGRQFRQSRDRAPRTLWHFEGGDVFLDLAITIYVIDSYRELPGALRVILEHELLHAKDELDLVRQHLPEALPRDRFVEQYLAGGEAIAERMYEDFFRGGRFSRWIHDTLWVPRHNENARARHTGPEWSRYQQRMDEEMRRGEHVPR